MTVTALQTTATISATTIDNDLQDAPPQIGWSWACNLCRLSFDNGQEQRKHMKSSWHVYNLKRRIASLPAISLVVFNDQAQLISEPAEKHENKKFSKHGNRDVASPHQCLFCHKRFDQDDQGLVDNLEHMSMSHGLFVPNPTMLVDIESFLGYLSTTIREWHECLYCGTSKNCTTAIQSHMIDRGHCKLNLERDPELLEFWEEKPQTNVGRLVKAPGQEPALVCGDTITLRSPHLRRNVAVRAHCTDRKVPLDPKPQQPRFVGKEQSCRQLSRRDETSLQNVGPQQRRALVLATKRSQKEEAAASRASEWSVSRKANKQKHDQAHGPLSWAKGGLHNLLPR